MPYAIFVLTALLLLSGCASNQVTRLDGPQTQVRLEPNSNGQRFDNLYPGKPSYPLTCDKNCYAPRTDIQCLSPMEQCQFTAQQSPPTVNSGFSIQWLGHASFYIKHASGTSVLIDPVSQQFDWPVDWGFRLAAGFFRNEPEWINAKQRQDLDAVLYSHIHYDHFNKADIDNIGTGPEYLVPLGFAEHFPSGGYRITEAAWFAQKQVRDLTMHFVPANHFSNRIWVPFIYEDDDKTLWGGWILEYQGKTLFFAGDTGYSPHFKDINRRYGQIDVCLLPIASYHHPENGNWYRYVHTTPEDALIAAQELGCKVMIPWGYGNASWKMGDVSSHSALFRLLNMHERTDSPIQLHILNEGEQISL